MVSRRIIAVLQLSLLLVSACSRSRQAVTIMKGGAYFDHGHPIVPVTIKAGAKDVTLESIEVSPGMDRLGIPLPIEINHDGEAEFHISFRRSSRDWRQQSIVFRFRGGDAQTVRFEDAVFRDHQ